MKQKKFFAILLIALFFTANTYGYDHLRVRDPQNWHSSQGTIEEAIISIQPKGLYMEVGLYLTFSARGWNYGSSDSLEVEFYFDLPENSIVHDSWLWVEDDIIRGEIMDKWTASAIYEDIVKRRRDPSILFKRGKRSYELRIYPMVASESRKVKLTYLVPTIWYSENILASLPTNLLRTSRYDVSTFYLLTWLNNDWQNPKILELQEIPFETKSDTTFGEYVQANIPGDAIQSTLHFSLNSPMKDGIYINSHKTGNEGTYQMALLPSQALDLSAESKVALLFDYDASKCNISTEEILHTVKSVLLSTMAEKDSFNLIFSQLNINRVSDTWLPADAQTIEQTFASLDDNPISSYSNLPALLANGIEFVKDNGHNGSIVLVSSTDQVGDYKIANQFIEDLLELMDPKIPIHIADFQDRNYNYYYFAGRSYVGNEYFYTNISRLTSANHFSLRSGYSFPDLILTTLNAISGFISSFDLHTRLQNGYCYARYDLNYQNNSTYLEQPILQIGKYQGDMPFVIEASGVFESDVFSHQIVVDEQSVNSSDSLSDIAWTGNYIEFLESQEQTNNVINEIVYHSINERILSNYTAFLCLEPSRGGQICYDCMDESSLLSIDDQNVVNESDSLLSAYPNPFNNQINIKFKLSNQTNFSNITMTIYNVLGQVVRSIPIPENAPGNQFEYIWYGKNDAGVEVSSGTYFCILKTPNNIYSLKLLYMK